MGHCPRSYDPFEKRASTSGRLFSHIGRSDVQERQFSAARSLLHQAFRCRDQKDVLNMIDNQMFKIRSVLESELPDVVSLELSCGLSTGGIDRFRRLLVDSSGILIGAFKKDAVTERQTLVGRTLVRQTIVGLICGTVVVDEFQIDNLVVKEDSRRRGIGVELINSSLQASAMRGAVTAVLEVRASNISAQKLYEKCKFEVVGRRLAYYPDPAEDALILRCQYASFFGFGAENSS